jgi:formamidopyrimidine-DNA glycosylase
VLEQTLGRVIAHVDDTDTYVCRPNSPGELDAALTGHRFVSAKRRGKFLWMETDDGPTLGLHLGMAGRIMLDRRAKQERWDRFTVEFDDGTWFALEDKRRLGRAILNPDFSHIGPDAADITRTQFRARVGAGNTAIKARLLDQGALAGVGNLLADQTLWQARIAPGRLTGSLSEAELDRLRRELRSATRSAIRKGGAHTGEFIPARGQDHPCPRCGHSLMKARIGGRTTYWCPVCQT